MVINRNRINNKLSGKCSGCLKKYDLHVFVKTGLVYDCQKSWHFLCRKMTVGYLQVQTPLACAHLIQNAKIIHGNDPQSLLLLMPGHKNPLWSGAAVGGRVPRRGGPFLHSSDLGYFVPWKFIIGKMTIISLLNLICSAMFMIGWKSNANKMIQNHALPLHGHNYNIIVCQTEWLVILLHGNSINNKHVFLCDILLNNLCFVSYPSPDSVIHINIK